MGNLLKVREAAERLRVSAATVYLLCGKGMLAHVRVGVNGKGTIRIDEADLAAFVEAGKAQGTAPTNAAGLKHIKVKPAGSR